MALILPEQKMAPTRLNPKILMLYSLPKVGKTKQLSLLESCLLLDLERGADMYECMRVPIANTAQVDEVIAAIVTKGAANGGKFPYKYLAVDTVDMLEEYCIKSATVKYNNSKLVGGKAENKVESVLDLSRGLGYFYIRSEVTEYLNKLSRVCQHLILVTHVKEKILDKGGSEVTVRDISLTGKLAGIVAAACDAIGYMYRDATTKGELWVNFESFDNSVMGARFEHLSGKKFPFAWDKIFLPNTLSDSTAETTALT